MSIQQSEAEAPRQAPAVPQATAHTRLATWLSTQGARVRRVVRPGDGGSSPFFLLRRRLILTNLAVAAIVFVALSGAIYAYEARTDLAQIDQVLAEEAGHEEHASSQGDGGALTPRGGPAYTPSSPDVFALRLAAPRTIVEDDRQAAQFSLPDWASADLVLGGKQPSVYVTVRRGDYTFRLYTAPVKENGRITGAVQAGTSMTRHDQVLENLLRALALLGVGVLALTGMSSVYLTERALAPARDAYVRQRQFTAAASHELRTPLAVIRSQAELVSGLLHDSVAAVRTTGADRRQIAAQLESVAEETAGITAEVDYMTRMVRDLLVLARDASDTQSLGLEWVDVGALAKETAEKVRPLAAAKDIQLVIGQNGDASASEPANVWADADRLRQVVLIFLDNAVKYTPAGGTVRVETRADSRHPLLGERGRHVALSVSDTGMGIPPEHLPHIFEPFYRATMHHVSEDAAGSTGLGLALAQWIAHAHGGEIMVTSAKGTGTTFTLMLPHKAE